VTGDRARVGEWKLVTFLIACVRHTFVLIFWLALVSASVV